MSDQLFASISNDSETMQPNHRSAVRFRAESMPAVLNHEEAFVSGALAISEDSISFHTASQGPSESTSQVSNFGRTSLEALELASSLVHVTLPENEDAISTALPIPNDEESLLGPVDSGTNNIHRRDFQEASSQAPNAPAVKSYASIIETLSLHLPHLTNVKTSSRQKNVGVTCYDYLDTLMVSVKTFTVMQPSDELRTAEGMSLQRYLEEAPPKSLQLRLIVTNDLCTDLIECLGTSFSMSPEVYEEHLINSGWLNGMDTDQEPDTWITRDMKKTHMSIKWYRPVKRVLQRPNSTSDRLRFLGTSAQPFSWTEVINDRLGFKPHGVQHVSKPATNIFRRGWDMRTDAEMNISAGGFAAWEERATLWNKQCNDYRVAVLLLDPLPTVEDEMTGAAEALQKLGIDHTEPTAKHGAMSEDRTENATTDSSVTDQPSRGLVKSSTFVRYRPKVDENFSFMSLGKLIFGRRLLPQDPSTSDGPFAEGPEAFHHAEDPESGEQGRDRQEKIRGIARPRARSRVPNFLGRLFTRSGRKTEKSDGADEVNVPEEEVGTEKITLKPMNRCMFEGLYPRGPAVDYELLMDPNNVDLLAEHLDRTKPTAVNLAEWLRHPSLVGPAKHLECLFAIIQNDTANTLRHMELALQDIGQHILDDTLIQQRLIHWRVLLERFGTELQQLEDSLRRFAVFIDASAFPHENNKEDPERPIPSVGKLLEDSVSQINALRQHTTRSHKSLMANMSIVESKRGIAEAESVTKLTELAFFFIPITFSASVFSMQVKELNASRISIAAFFILAIIVTTASYALRLLIRSENFIELRKKTLKDIRQDAGLASGSSIPTKTFVAWLWRRAGVANMRFLMGFKRLLPFLAYHHILIIWLAIAITLFSVVLSACTSSTATPLGLYLTCLSYQPVSNSTSPSQVNPNLTTTFGALVNGSSLEVRAGYFGLCVRYAGGIWVCSSDPAGLARLFQPYQDPLNLIWVQARFREGIGFSGLLIAAIALAFIAMCLLFTFPGWHEEHDDNGSARKVRPFPSRPVSQTALATSTLASLLALVSMIWQHTASVAAATTAQDLGYGTVRSEVGATSLALGWVGFAMMALPAIDLLKMILSIRLLDQLTEDE